MALLISGEGASDLAVWTTIPTGQPSTPAVSVRLVDAKSGTARGPQIQVSRSLANQGVGAVYNPASRRYLVLWQSRGEISGQLLNDHLEAAGAAFQIPAHDFYVRPGELTTDPAGGFLFCQAENGSGVRPQTRVFLTRFSAGGQPLNTVSWPVSDDARPFQFAEAHAVYIPNPKGYLVAWSLYGTTGSILADRMIDEHLSPVSGVQTVAHGVNMAGADFALAYEPQSATTRVIWLGRSTPGAPNLLSVRLNGTGAPEGPPRFVGQVSPFPAQYPANLGGLTLTPAGREEIANWAGGSTNDTFTLPVTGMAPGTLTRTPQNGLPSVYSHASATNAAARTLVVLNTSNQGTLSQLYARVTRLPNKTGKSG
jgi:hypothetical protein